MQPTRLSRMLIVCSAVVRELQAALRGAAGRFSPENAAFMLKQFTRSAATRSPRIGTM
jgi:hypothetical protein